VASSGLFPQPLWINVCGKRRQSEVIPGWFVVSRQAGHACTDPVRGVRGVQGVHEVLDGRRMRASAHPTHLATSCTSRTPVMPSPNG
jgi:hypothetical protein